MKKLAVGIGVFVLCLVGIGFVNADSCNIRNRTVYSTYVAPVKVVTDNYQYNYGYEKIVLVPKAIAVEVHRDHYYSIDGYYQQQLLADAIVGRLLAAKIKLGEVPGTQPGQPPAPVQPTEPGPGVKPDLTSLGPSKFQDANLVKTIQTSCVKCHGSTSDFPLLTNDDKLRDLPEGALWKAFALVNSGEMPKANKPLDDESVKLFYAWAKGTK